MEKGQEMKLSNEESRLIYRALHSMANASETGDPSISALDIENMRDPERERRYPRRALPPPRALTQDQMRVIVKLRDLANRFLA